MGLWDKGVKLSGTFYYKAGTHVFAILSCTLSVLPFRKARQTTPDLKTRTSLQHPYKLPERHVSRNFPMSDQALRLHQDGRISTRKWQNGRLVSCQDLLSCLVRLKRGGALVIEWVCERWGFLLEFGFGRVYARPLRL